MPALWVCWQMESRSTAPEASHSGRCTDAIRAQDDPSKHRLNNNVSHSAVDEATSPLRIVDRIAIAVTRGLVHYDRF